MKAFWKLPELPYHHQDRWQEFLPEPESHLQDFPFLLPHQQKFPRIQFFLPDLKVLPGNRCRQYRRKWQEARHKAQLL